MPSPNICSRSSLLLLGIASAILLFVSAVSTSRNVKIPLIDNVRRSSSLKDIQNSTLGFEKIFAINLPSRTDHRDAMALAASVTGLDVEFVEGVTEVATKAMPPGHGADILNNGQRGNWRAHMDVAQMMIEDNVSSALILEDDVDWDVRIKDQMQDFARAARLLLQPLQGTSNAFLDPTYPRPGPDGVASNVYISNATTSTPLNSPYGDLDRWDMLWIGHCGTFFPSAAKSPEMPIGRAVIPDDITVPEPQHIGIMIGNDELRTEYPPHTRVVSRALKNTCTFGYALSLPGARKLLYEFGIRKLDEATDISFRQFCDGEDRSPATCLTVQPELIGQHRPAGRKSAFSDIEGFEDSVNEQAYTRNIRWSTKLNLRKLIDGATDFLDLYKDGEPGTDRGWGHGH